MKRVSSVVAFSETKKLNVIPRNQSFDGEFKSRNTFEKSQEISDEELEYLELEEIKQQDLSLPGEYNNGNEDDVYSSKDKIIKNYKVLEFIGKGTFGKVFKCSNIKDGKIYAMKI